MRDLRGTCESEMNRLNCLLVDIREEGSEEMRDSRYPSSCSIADSEIDRPY